MEDNIDLLKAIKEMKEIDHEHKTRKRVTIITILMSAVALVLSIIGLFSTGVLGFTAKLSCLVLISTALWIDYNVEKRFGRVQPLYICILRWFVTVQAILFILGGLAICFL